MFANQINSPKNGALSSSSSTLPDTILLSDDISKYKNDKKKNCCQKCHRKVGLTGFKCYCEGLFCSIHRYAEEHLCSYDYLNENKKDLLNKLDNIGLAKKLDKI